MKTIVGAWIFKILYTHKRCCPYCLIAFFSRFNDMKYPLLFWYKTLYKSFERLVTIFNAIPLEYIAFSLLAKAKKYNLERREFIIFTEKQNNSFINKNCEICGHTDLVLSSIQLCCNYGSKYDGEQITLNVCSNCADRIYKFITELKE